MGYSPEDLEAIAKKLRMDLTNAQVKLTDLMNGISDLATKLPSDGHGLRCSQCELPFSSAQRLAEHQENVHGVRA